MTIGAFIGWAGHPLGSASGDLSTGEHLIPLGAHLTRSDLVPEKGYGAIGMSFLVSRFSIGSIAGARRRKPHKTRVHVDWHFLQFV